MFWFRGAGKEAYRPQLEPFRKGTAKEVWCMGSCLLCVLMKPPVRSTYLSMLSWLDVFKTCQRTALRQKVPGGGSTDVSKWPSHIEEAKNWAWLCYRKSEVDNTEGSRYRPVFKTFPHRAKHGF